MASWDIRHGYEEGPILDKAASPDKGPYFVVGNGGKSHGSFDTWNEAVTKRNQLRRQQIIAFQQGQGGNGIA